MTEVLLYGLMGEYKDTGFYARKIHVSYYALPVVSDKVDNIHVPHTGSTYFVFW